MKAGVTQDTILHEGIVTAVKDGQVEVRIQRTSSCTACAAAGLCKAAKASSSVVTASCQGEQPRVGESVTVEGTVGQGLRATLWAYVVPLVLLIVVLSVCVALLHNEGVAALVAICAVAVYYVLLHYCGGRLLRGLSFRVKRV